MMTKQDFVALADAFKQSRPMVPFRAPQDTAEDAVREALYHGRTQQWEDMRTALADLCAASNPRFDRERWLAYITGEVGPSGGAVKGRS